jgi:hypothetical protein
MAYKVGRKYRYRIRGGQRKRARFSARLTYTAVFSIIILVKHGV